MAHESMPQSRGQSGPAGVLVSEALAYTGAGGRVSARTTTLGIAGSTTGDLNNHSFTQTFAWNELGLPSALGYGTCGTTTPCHGVGDRGVYPTYTAGLLTGVGPYYAQAITYHWSGLPKTVTHTRRLLEVGNGVTETTSIDLATMLARPQSIATGNVTSTAGTAANWSTGSYAYDGTGNIISTYLSSSSLETYRYDGLSRLTSAKRTAAGASTTQTYVYDDYGNLTSYAGASLPTSTSTNRLTAATYDAAGHTTAWGGFTYTWDAQSQLIGESGNLLGRIFAYSADGERLLQRDGSTTTLSLRDLDGKVIRELSLAAGTAGAKWTCKRDNIYRNGLLLASVAPGEGIKHHHLDHLGTPRQVTNRTGQQLVRHDYWPYGREASLSGNQTPDRMRFTGHERDLNLLDRENDDLDYMHARYYNPTNLGRFVSVDAGSGMAGMSQSWNRFSYTAGNPLRRVDPNGETFTEFVAGVVNGFSSSMLMNAGRVTPTSRDMSFGQAFGDVWAVYAGALEAEMGAGTFLGGSGGTVVSGGSVAAISVPVAAAGAGMVVQGTGAVLTGASNLAKFASSTGAAGGGEPSSRGNLTKVPDSELKRRGIDAHQLKREIVPGQGSRYDVFRDSKTGELYLVRKGKGGEAPIPTGEKLTKATDPPFNKK